jgi:hypothetical protein
MTEIHQTVHDKLQRALQEFARTQRFALFKDIQVGRLMPEECEGDSVLYNLTFEALASQPGRVSGDGQLCTPAQAESLLHLLAALSEDAEVSDASLRVAETDSEQRNQSDTAVDSAEPSEQTPSIVQLEQDLHSLRSRLKAHPNYEKVAAKTLGDFWKSDWTPAPFEEMLSIRQLLSIDVAALFKKKTVTESRMLHVCQALERVLDVLDRSPDMLMSTQHTQPQLCLKKADFSTFMAGSRSDCSLAALAVYEALERGCLNQHESRLASLAASLFSTFSAEECVDVLLGRDIAPTLFRRLSMAVRDAVEPATLNLIQRLLEGPAVRIEYVAQVLCASYAQPTAFIACVSTFVARALGASEIRYRGKTYAGFWTINTHLLRGILRARSRRSVPRGGSKQSRSSQESLDPFLLQMIQAQGRPPLSRKGRPKELKSRRRGGR